MLLLMADYNVVALTGIMRTQTLVYGTSSQGEAMRYAANYTDKRGRETRVLTRSREPIAEFTPSKPLARKEVLVGF
jgi:hypothetical protein